MAVDLFSADFLRTTDTDLYAAIIEFVRYNAAPQDRTREGYTVDFKEKWGDKALKVVAAFANTFGGIIIVGVSEANGRAKDLVGEDSKGELKTRLAGSIAASITPTPSFDIGECVLPGQPSRRLGVIRVRSTDRIHFLTTQDTPVYVRNEDQAIPARAAELRNLIARERDNVRSSPSFVDQNRLTGHLPITKEQKVGVVQGVTTARQRIAADSVFRVWIVPDEVCKISLDYDTEQVFRNVVFRIFPSDSFTEDIDWTSSEEIVRESTFVRIDYAHVQRDLQSKWVFTSLGEFGYGTVLSEGSPPAGQLWSLSDLTAELIAAIRSAHTLLANFGYLGEAHVYASANPAEGQLLISRGDLPFIRHNSGRPSSPAVPWREIVPNPPSQVSKRWVLSTAPANFHARVTPFRIWLRTS